MSNFPGLSLRATDSLGNALVGAKLYTYAATTVNAKATYSDEACTAPNINANPMISDANGWFGECYLLTDGAYKFVLKDSADTTIKTWDNINAVTLRSTSFQARIQQVASNPLDYGAVGDGVADESSQVQDAIDNATGVVDLLGKTYRCDNAIALAAGITLRNGALDFSNCADAEYIKAIGTRAASTLLTANSAAGDETLELASVAGMSAGDWIYLTSDTNFSGTNDQGEVCLIESIAALIVTISEQALDTYNTADNAYAQKLNLLSGIVIEDLDITCSAAAATGRAVYLELVRDVTVRNVRVSSPKTTAFEVRAGVDVRFEGCVGIGYQNTGVGFEVGCHSRGVSLEGCQAHNFATGFRTGSVDTNDGVTRYVSVAGSGAFGCTLGYHAQAQSEFVQFGGYIVKPSGGTAYTDSGESTRFLGLHDIVGGTIKSDWGAMSGDGTITAGGALTLANPQRVLTSSKTLNKTGAGADGAIIGSGAGSLGHAAGVTLVAGVPAYIIVPVFIDVKYTYSTAAYTGGGALNLVDGSNTASIDASAVFTAGASFRYPYNNAKLNRTGGNPLALASAAAYTDPGTAAGTAVVTTYYRLIPA